MLAEHTRILGSVLLCAASLAPSPISAQAPAGSEARSDRAGTGHVHRDDLVQNDLHTQATKGTLAPFHRSGSQQGDGLYGVKINSEDGRLRMSGTYIDSTYATPHGNFQYYHTNGRLESSGEFIQGIKSGVWHRYALNGDPLAERIYGGLSLEDMEIENGIRSVAHTVGRVPDLEQLIRARP